MGNIVKVVSPLVCLSLLSAIIVSAIKLDNLSHIPSSYLVGTAARHCSDLYLCILILSSIILPVLVGLSISYLTHNSEATKELHELVDPLSRLVNPSNLGLFKTSAEIVRDRGLAPLPTQAV